MLTIEKIRQNNLAVGILALYPFEFDTYVSDDDTEEIWFKFEDERPFKYLAADGCGGEFISTRHKQEEESAVWCISSDAQASRLGNNLREAIEHILTIPFWMNIAHQDLEEMIKRYETDLAEVAKDNDQWLDQREQVASAFNLDVRSTHIERLHQSLAIGVQEQVLVNGEIAINGFSNNW